jgi:hypothetical protein
VVNKNNPLTGRRSTALGLSFDDTDAFAIVYAFFASGPHGKQFFDLDGAYNPAVGRTEERVGFAGGFTHGVTVFGGTSKHIFTSILLCVIANEALL